MKCIRLHTKRRYARAHGQLVVYLVATTGDRVETATTREQVATLIAPIET